MYKELEEKFASWLRAIYLHFKANPPWLPNKFRPKKFELAQIYALVIALEVSKLWLEAVEIVRNGAAAGDSGDDSSRALAHLLDLGFDKFAPLFVEIGELNHRRLVQLLKDSSTLRSALELKCVPHYSTLAKVEAHARRLTEPRFHR